MNSGTTAATEPGVRTGAPALARPASVGRAPVVPALHMPFPARTSPHLAMARRHAVDWARESGMLDEGLWTSAGFTGSTSRSAAAVIHAEAEPGQLALSADWLTWGTYADDLYAATFGPGGT